MVVLTFLPKWMSNKISQRYGGSVIIKLNFTTKILHKFKVKYVSKFYYKFPMNEKLLQLLSRVFNFHFVIIVILC